MKKIPRADRSAKTGSVAAGVWLLCLLFPAAGLAGTNLLGDAAFDLSTNPGGFPNSGQWLDDHIGEAGAVLDGVSPRSGPFSLHLYTGGPAAHYLTRPRQVDLSSNPGRAYHGGGYLRTRTGNAWQNGSAAFFRVAFFDGLGGELTHYDSPSYVTANDSWALYELTTPAAPANTAVVRFTIYLSKPNGLAGQSVANTDDLFLEEIELAPALALAPLRLPFGATNDSLKLRIANAGGGSLGWSVSASAATWLEVLPPSSGSTPSGEQDLVEVRVDRGGLSLGNYRASLSVTPSSGQTVAVPVEMRVAPAVPAAPAMVTVDGRRLLVQKRRPDGGLAAASPYRMRGFAYSPAGTATTSALVSRRQAFQDWQAIDFGLLRGAGANTLYVFLDFGLNLAEYQPVLDSAYRNDLMVVMTVDEDGNYNQVRAQAVVAAYRNHPAVLMWAIGNEWNINRYHGQFATVLAAAQATETLAQAIQGWDATHPVASIYGDIAIEGQNPDTAEIVGELCPSVDLWGLNIYRGQQFGDLFDSWEALSGKPIFLSEFGIDSLHTTQYFPDPIAGYSDEAEQAAWNHSLWTDLQAELSADDPARTCLGGTFFAWNDEWWKVLPAGQHDAGGFFTDWNPAAFPDSFANEEYFGSVQIDGDLRIPKAAYYQIRYDFLSSEPSLFADGFESGSTAAWH